MRSSLFTTLALLIIQQAFAAIPDSNVRPAFDNETAPNRTGGVTLYQGNISRGTTGPGSNGKYLSESRFGHHFAITQSFSPSATYAQTILRNGATGVYDILYPEGYGTPTGVTASHSQIQNPSTGGAFRYKWLMFGEDGADANGDPIILSLFADLAGDADTETWFTDADRQKARDQIVVLRDALAIAPLDRELQTALLDIYYDLATAEMQFVNKRLAKLAIIRLGLDSTPSNFIIDDEITIYRELIQIVGQAAAWYSELLCLEETGVDPGDFASAFAGEPYGRFVYKYRVPGRSQTATAQGSSASTPLVAIGEDSVATFEIPGDHNDFQIAAIAPVPKNFRVVILEGDVEAKFGAATLAISARSGTTTVNEIKTAIEAVRMQGNSQQLFTVTNTAPDNGGGTIALPSGSESSVIDPSLESDIVFAGYKDHRTFITILGQLIQYKCDLARLLALRRSTGDLTEARQLLAAVQGPDSNTFLQLQGLFPDTNFDDPKLDATGIRAALTLFKTALSDCASVRSFVNGTSNVLGLDPNFLLLVQKNEADLPKDSYDVLAERVNKVAGDIPTGALAVALDELGDPDQPTNGGGAIQAFNTFSSSVSAVASDLLDLEIGFANRFEEITGYAWNGGVNDWDGQNPKAGETGSELATVKRTISGLEQENERLGQILKKGREDVKKANNSVTLAEDIKDSIVMAENKYLEKANSAWAGLGISNTIAAGARELADTTQKIASVSSPPPAAFAAIKAIGIAGAANGAVQTANATLTRKFEQDLDSASIQYNTKLALSGQALTVQQSALAIGALEREVLSNRLQLDSNANLVAQAQADKAALLREVQRIEENFRSSKAGLASSYFADPIHYQRAEASLLVADASFRRAQRWLFILGRALEYKWQEKFSYANPQIGESIDLGSIFKSRNALELKRIFQNMAFFDADRNTSPGTRRDDLATISLRDRVLTPNPDDVNKEFGAFPEDNDLRVDSTTGRTVSKVQHFRNLLRSLQTSPENGFGGNGPISIPIDTTQLEIGQLFGGPRYTFSPSGELTNIESGLYRDKITWMAVHFVFEDGSSVNSNNTPSIPGNNGIEGSMTYSGNTYFRTRIPPYPDLSMGAPLNASDLTIPDQENSGTQARRDFEGEFIITPFRYFQNTDPSVFHFETFDQQNAPTLEYLFSTQSAETPEVAAAITNASGFQIKDFQELSVATSRLILKINGNQFRIDDLKDIEILVQHTAYSRPQVALP